MEALIKIAVLLILVYLVISETIKVRTLKAELLILEELFKTKVLLSSKIFNKVPVKILQKLEDNLLEHYFHYLPIIDPVEIGKYITDLKSALPAEVKTKNYIITILEGAILNFSAAKLSDIMLRIVESVGKRPKQTDLEALAVMRNLFLEVINQRMSDSTAKDFYRIFTRDAYELFVQSCFLIENEVLMSIEINEITKTFKFEYLIK